MVGVKPESKTSFFGWERGLQGVLWVAVLMSDGDDWDLSDCCCSVGNESVEGLESKFRVGRLKGSGEVNCFGLSAEAKQEESFLSAQLCVFSGEFVEDRFHVVDFRLDQLCDARPPNRSTQHRAVGNLSNHLSLMGLLQYHINTLFDGDNFKPTLLAC